MRVYFELLLLVAFIGLAMYSIVYARMVVYARARRKGYRAVGLNLVAGAGALITLIACLASIVFSAQLELSRWLAASLALASPFVGLLTMFATLWLLPKRQVRVFSPRRGARLFLIAGWITWSLPGLGIVLFGVAVFLTYDSPPGPTAMRVFFELLLPGAAMVTLFGLAMYSIGYGCVVAYARARRKGYHAVGATLVLLAGALITPIAFVASLVFSAELKLSGWLMLPLVFASSFVGLLTMFATLWLLPKRQVRVFGPRRGARLFVIAGWITWSLGGLGIVLFGTAVFLTYDSIRVERFWMVPFVFGVLGYAVWTLGDMLVGHGKIREGQPTLETVLAQDPRAPVLYLRPFANEHDTFVCGERLKYGPYKQGLIVGKGAPVAITFDEYLGPAIEHAIGPWVALGSPEDFGTPYGAARKYAKDDAWQEDFKRLARSAVAMVIPARTSGNLRWELEHIRREGWHERLYLVTSHPTHLAHGKLMRLAQRLAGMSNESWHAMSNTLAELGYDVGLSDPGPGAVLSFDASGRGVLLTTAADLPVEYVEPIRAHVFSDASARADAPAVSHLA